MPTADARSETRKDPSMIPGRSPGRPWWHHVPLEHLRVRAAVPHRGDAADGLVLLPDRFRGRWTGWLQRWLPAERRAEEFRLDARGATVWRALLVESNTVREIIAAYARAHPEDAAQADVRVLRFLGGLEQEGCVEFVREDAAG